MGDFRRRVPNCFLATRRSEPPAHSSLSTLAWRCAPVAASVELVQRATSCACACVHILAFGEHMLSAERGRARVLAAVGAGGARRERLAALHAAMLLLTRAARALRRASRRRPHSSRCPDHRASAPRRGRSHAWLGATIGFLIFERDRREPHIPVHSRRRLAPRRLRRLLCCVGVVHTARVSGASSSLSISALPWAHATAPSSRVALASASRLWFELERLGRARCRRVLLHALPASPTPRASRARRVAAHLHRLGSCGVARAVGGCSVFACPACIVHTARVASASRCGPSALPGRVIEGTFSWKAVAYVQAPFCIEKAVALLVL